MQKKECIAMILAGGKGTRLGALTNSTAKPAVNYGGKYRIIDFTLSNCVHSGIDSLGVLTQYQPMALHDYIRDGQTWDLKRMEGGVFMLPSTRDKGVYSGTADAVYQNIDFIEKFNPEHVLILSGDHVYKMDYEEMLNYHKETDADITISVISVPQEEAHRFGIINVNSNGRIVDFAEKPNNPKSNLASMGIYLFKWSCLKSRLTADQYNILSDHDFGKNIIPAALSAGKMIHAFKFDGYWRDVGTVQSLWESNMDLLSDMPPINLYDDGWTIFTRTKCHAPCYLASGAEVKRSIVTEGCHVYGRLKNSILFDSVTIGEAAEVTDSIIMPNVVIGRGAKIHKSIIGSYAVVGENAEIGADEGINSYLDNKICSKGISLIGPGVHIERDMKILRNSHISDVLLQEHSAKNRKRRKQKLA